MILSIVTGTFNRLDHLKQFMNSCRDQIPRGIDYEFCICDGGSTDGTLEYLKSMSDVRLVEHGELKGAVKAFNDAAELATGDYLLLGNDDVEVLPYSIMRGLAHLINDPQVGAACFYQDRDGQGAHVAKMRDLYYIQVGIVPTWLWRYCGGWGDFGLTTYGGDNYLSAKIYEAGYKIEPVPGSMIHDKTVNDVMRERNLRETVQNSDGDLLWRQFPNGIRVMNSPQIKNPLPKMKRCVYAPIFEPGFEVQKKQKIGMLEALKKAGYLVWQVDYAGGEDVVKATALWKPDLFFSQYHNKDNRLSSADLRTIRESSEVMINFVGDFWPEMQLEPEFVNMLKLYDRAYGVNNDLQEPYSRLGVNFEFMAISFEPGIMGGKPPVAYDVVFVGNAYTKERKEFAAFLKSMDGVKTLVVGDGYPPGVAAPKTTYDFEKTGDLIRSAKIVIGDNQFANVQGFLSDRFFNSLAASGPILLHQKVNKLKELTGFEDGVHYVSWNDLPDLESKIRKYLDDEEARKKIAAEGTSYCLAHHSFDNRVRQIEDFVASSLNKRRADKRSISTFLIVKNEEKHISRVVGQALEYSDEVAITDTGSTDSTKDVLAAMKDPRIKVYDYDPGDFFDFSKARNYAQSKCTKNWIMWLDADDFITPEVITKLKGFRDWDFYRAGINFPHAFRFWTRTTKNGKPSLEAMQYRLYINDKNIFWRNPIHESVEQSIGESGFITMDAEDVYIKHLEATPEERKRKHERNLSILKRMPNSFWSNYHIGSEYATMENWARAMLYWQKALNMAKQKEDKDFILFCCGMALYEEGFVKESVDYFKNSDFVDALYMRARIENDVQKLVDFLNSESPNEYPTRYHEWQAHAKKKLLDWCDKVREII